MTLLTDSDALERRLSSAMETINVDVLRATGTTSVATIAKRERVALAVLHWDLLGFAAIECCAALKSDPVLASLPVLVFSEWTSAVAERTAIDAGADDYLTARCGDHDVVLRVGARLDGKPMTASGRFLFYADLALDLPGWRLHCGGTSASLSIADYDLLCMLMRHPDQPLSRKRLVDGMSPSLPRRREDRINVHVRQLRHVLSKIGSRVAIRSEDGVGYSLTSTRSVGEHVTKR